MRPSQWPPDKPTRTQSLINPEQPLFITPLRVMTAGSRMPLALSTSHLYGAESTDTSRRRKFMQLLAMTGYSGSPDQHFHSRAD